jgi:hypothetical protein
MPIQSKLDGHFFIRLTGFSHSQHLSLLGLDQPK